MSAVVLLLACAATEPSPVPDVVLISLDTTRADRIGAYGYSGAHTPTLDGLAAEGRRYSRAYSPLPLTIPAHASLHTGASPERLGVRTNGAGRLEPSMTTLAEHLARRGWTTGAAVGAFVTSRTWGFDQGFGTFLDTLPASDDPWHVERPAGEVVDAALGWWESADGPRFLWVHLYDPHFPYRPADPSVLNWVDGRPYDGEIAYVDREVGRLLSGLGARPRVVVVVGDHGEGLAEHAELTHGLFVYESTQRVPWILAGPGVAPAVVDQPVSLLDVAPTLVDLLGLPPLPDAEGQPVPSADPRPVLLESWQLPSRYGIAPHLGVVDGPLKLIATPRPELYDVVVDPGEQVNLAASRPADVARLRRQLEGIRPPVVDAAHPVAPGDRAQLLALGYVAGSVVPDLENLPDPKDRGALLAGAQRVERAILLRDWEVADTELRALRATDPAVVELASLHATVLGRLGRTAEAEPVIAEALALDPDNAMLQLAHGNALIRHGELAEAVPLITAAAEALPFVPRLRARALAVLAEVGRTSDAVDLGQTWHREGPADPALAGVLGVQLVNLGRIAEALPLLEEGLGAAPPAPDVAYHLAAARLGAGDRAASRALLERELDAHPGNVRALLAWARLISATADWNPLASRAERALAEADSAVLRHVAGQALFNAGEVERAAAHVRAGLAVDPGDPDLLLLDANLLHAAGDQAAAERRFAEAQAARSARQ
ncbi:MAG: choline-sulfatase [Myxococcota bacterium]|jgi:choline-sulfatase